MGNAQAVSLLAGTTIVEEGRFDAGEQGAAPGNCEAIVTMAAAGNIPFRFVSRSHGFAILGITGYNPATVQRDQILLYRRLGQQVQL